MRRRDALLKQLGPTAFAVHLLMDRAYEGNETRALAASLGFIPVVPPRQKRLDPWEYDKELYKRRNEVERLFRRLTIRETLEAPALFDCLELPYVSRTSAAVTIQICARLQKFSEIYSLISNASRGFFGLRPAVQQPVNLIRIIGVDLERLAEFCPFTHSNTPRILLPC